jgi:hypothetical protein
LPKFPALIYASDLVCTFTAFSLLQYVNPTDYYMSVLKDKGDDLVQAWAKQVGRQLGCCASTLAPLL